MQNSLEPFLSSCDASLKAELSKVFKEEDLWDKRGRFFKATPAFSNVILSALDFEARFKSIKKFSHESTGTR